MLRPSRRPRFNAATLASAENAFGSSNCNLRINTFYKAPVGKESWAVKHIKPRRHVAKSSANVNNVTEPNEQKAARRPKYQPVYRRLPIMRPSIQPAPNRFVSNVIKNHYRTQDVLEESSNRAFRECCLSQDAVRRARDTLMTWTDALDNFKMVCDERIEAEMNKSPSRFNQQR